jgi:hypothetical protein
MQLSALGRRGFRLEGVHLQKACFGDAFHDGRFSARLAADPTG